MPDRRDLHSAADDRTSADESDWSTLLGQAVDNIARILRSEADIAQTRIGQALNGSIAAWLAILPMLVLVVWGAGCLLLASVLLMHLWIPLWQAFGIAGSGLMVTGTIGVTIMRRRARQAT